MGKWCNEPVKFESTILNIKEIEEKLKGFAV